MHDAVVVLELLDNFERYGKWGITSDDHAQVAAAKQRESGVEAYIEYRNKELENLVGEFPAAWSKVCDNGFSIRLSQAIAGIYSN